MAQKTIVELEEIVDVDVDGGFFVVDSGVQTFKMKAANVGRQSRKRIQAVSSTSPITAANGRTYLCTVGGVPITVPASPTTGDWFTVVDLGGNFGTTPTTIIRAASEKIANVAATFRCSSKYGSYTFVCNVSDWILVNSVPQIDPSTKVVSLGAYELTNNQIEIPGNGYITQNTSDGSDNKTFTFGAGGGGSAWNSNRGAGFILNGNEKSGAEGEAVWYAGNSGGTFGRHRFVCAGVDVGLISNAGQHTTGPSAGGVTHPLYGARRYLTVGTFGGSATNNALSTANIAWLQRTVNPGSNITLNGLTGGVAGQILYISNNNADGRTLIIVHAAGVNQQIFTATGGNISLPSGSGVCTLICDGTNWFAN